MPTAQALIADRLEAWGFVPFVLRELFDDPAPSTIAAALDDLCMRALGSGIADAEFFEASVGSTHGVRLADGRRVVIKLHRPGRSSAFLRAAQTVQRHLAAQAFPCPHPLAGPEPVGAGYATAESLIDRGSSADAHEPAIRRAMATTLAELVERCRALPAPTGLAQDAMRRRPGALWPTPHDGRFDFPGTTAGAEWIDDVARRARAVLAAGLAGDPTIGHTDWRAQNLRFADGQVSAVYDWDSLAIERETDLVGSAAHAFTSNWADPPAGRQFPAFEEATAFIGEYERARRTGFTDAERRATRAALAYSMAYTARCEHSDTLTGFGSHPPDSGRQEDAAAGEATSFLGAHASALLAGHA